MKKLQKSRETVSKDHPLKRTNRIIEDYGDWLLIDISTPKYPEACMAVDKDIFVDYMGGRIFASQGRNNIYGTYWSGKPKKFHHNVIHIPKGLFCDHIFHYPYEFVDNRRSNLRAVTKSENGMNSTLSSNNTSGVTGITWHVRDKRWQATIIINGKRKHLGYFTDKNDAIKARKQAESELFGEFAFNASTGES